MGTELDPVVGNWYQRMDSDERFEVLAVDEDAGTVEVQYYDGDVEEMDIDAWYGLDLDAIEAPEEWAGDAEPDTAGATKGSGRTARNWEQDSEDWEDEEETEDDDDEDDRR